MFDQSPRGAGNRKKLLWRINDSMTALRTLLLIYYILGWDWFDRPQSVQEVPTRPRPSYLWLVSSQHVDHDLHDSLVHSQHSHQVGMLVENLVVHDVAGSTRRWFVNACVICAATGRSSLCLLRHIFLPQSINHELLLLLAHAHRQQRPDLTQRRQQVNGILHRGGTDGVGFLHGPEQLPDAVVLPPQQAEHHSDQLRVLDMSLLSPAGYGLGDQLLQVRWRSKK